MILLCYPTCSTCRKAKSWLTERGLAFEERHIAQDNPTAGELGAWADRSGLNLKKFFNTSGMRYRELGLKDRLEGMSREEQLELLASDGMLVKRPILVNGEEILVGFREKEWEKLLK